MCWVPREICGIHWEVTIWHEQDPPGASGPHQLHWYCSGKEQEKDRGTIQVASFLQDDCSGYYVHNKWHNKYAFDFFFLLQQDGKLPFVPGDEEMILGVSKYGVKVASLDQCVSSKALEKW